MSKDDDKRRADAAAKRAADLFDRQQQSEEHVADEGKRRRDMLAKTARLRQQRLARDAAEVEATKTQPKGRGPRK